jgi:fibronectin type 3 domain-containing protein
LTRDAIVVEWPPVERASAYVVERRAGSAGSFEEIGRVEPARFGDAGFQNGETYFYRVRAIAGRDASEAEGPVSEAASITPRDTFAPERPAGLSAVATPNTIELSWERNPEADVAGYRVRRGQAGSEPLVLNEALVETANYSDAQVTRGQEYSYQVTAVDGEGNESEPSRAVAVRVPQ